MDSDSRPFMPTDCLAPTPPSAAVFFLRRFIPTLLLTVLGACATLPAQPSPHVILQGGVLEGAHFGKDPANAAFLGIPYAASPVGNLRWQPPQPPPPWSGVRQAKAFGPACPQLPSAWLPETLGRKQMITDEACLYLNVWTTDLASKTRLPVMVWIHGGGNIEGSQEWPPLGPTLASHGVVVVSINYRLGVFGFFAHPALSAESAHHASGNYGMLDQMQALRWVHQNIGKFGGDPNQVTVFGASSGSLDICDLMASPLAVGLFQRAILQSGFCVDSNASLLSKAEMRGVGLAKILGIANNTQTLANLRAIPADMLLKTAAADPDEDFDPIVDDWVLPQQPLEIFAEGKQARIPVLLGSNADEVSIFASPIVGGSSNHPKTVAAYRQWLGNRFHARADEVFAAYPALTDSQVPQTFVKMDSDFDFGFGAWLMARETQATGQSAFLYRFTYVGSGELASLGAFHSEESILLSKKYWKSWAISPSDEKLSNIIIKYWTQFAKTSYPASLATPPWPPYDPAANQAQELGRHVGQIPLPNLAGMKAFQNVMNDQR
jgi:para-nitrobenzyl esterase